MENIKLDQLSPEARAQLLKEAEQKIANQKNTEREERNRFKELVSDEVNMLFGVMAKHVADMKDAKLQIYQSLQTLILSKSEVYQVEGDQKTHTFTNAEGTKRIVIGYRDISDWDGTETAGVEKVQTYLQSLASNDTSGKTAKVITALMKPDRSGKMDPRRIVELKNIAEEINDAELLDGVNIIMAAYKIVKSADTLTVFERVDSKWRNIELDFSDVNIVRAVKESEAVV